MALHDAKYGYLAAFPRPGHPCCIGVGDEAEPAFVLRGNDRLALALLYDYLARARVAGCDPDFLDQVDAAVGRFAAWAGSHPTKTPD